MRDPTVKTERIPDDGCSAPTSERAVRLALSCVVEGGEPAVSEVATASGPVAAWDQVVAGRFGDGLAERASHLDLDRVLERAARSRARFVVPGDQEWPERLGDLRFCDEVQRRGGVPFGLWLRGPAHLAQLAERSVAIVGSRAATPYGTAVATDLAAELAEHGFTVISGGAYGIDTAAHQGALAVTGPTVAVLANGVDVGYPQGNAKLFDWVAEHGLIVSELAPGTHPSRVRFLARNRLIAALGLGTVVVEAALRSGARNTASWALGCGRVLMAVPGSVESAMSGATHLMIRNGQAVLVTSVAEVLELVSESGQQLIPFQQGPTRATDDLDPVRLAVYEAVPARRRVGAGEIALAAGVSMPTALAQLSALEVAGLVVVDEVGWRAVVSR
ncbi:MAG: DNA-processing protein DprA [Microlunatus sp.]|nr:DNA-processing protein DprA [Microlunatus sp.]MDN5770839.1 DNA-processing protein DprA [Microlunatus sp.]